MPNFFYNGNGNGICCGKSKGNGNGNGNAELIIAIVVVMDIGNSTLKINFETLLYLKVNRSKHIIS